MSTRLPAFGSAPPAPHSSVRVRSFANEETGAMASEASAETYELLVSCAAEVLTVLVTPGREMVLGRDLACDVPIDDTTVSRRHAMLVVHPHAVTITDLGSSNGTRIGGARLGANVQVELAAGTVVELGQATLVLQRRRTSLAATERTPSARPRATPSVNPSRVVVDPTMRNLYAMLDIVASSQIAVLVLGETGVGKEVFAAEVHRRSRRASGPFIPMNCAALPDSILEAELFGYEKGAFTGAHASKVGLFEAANGGTLFLDEIGDMPLATQAKVLRVLESGEILRLGSVKPRMVDVRIVAATNRDIPTMIEAGQFRADLYFRLNGVTLPVPPLRHRRTEIVPLAAMFVELAANRHGLRPPVLSPEAAAHLVEKPWPGNVRELRNTIERAVVLCHGPVLLPDHLDAGEGRASTPPGPAVPEASLNTMRMFREDLAGLPTPPPPPSAVTPVIPPPPPRTPRDLPGELKALERERIVDALARCAGNQSQAARMLGMSRTTLIARIREFELARPRKPQL